MAEYIRCSEPLNPLLRATHIPSVVRCICRILNSTYLANWSFLLCIENIFVTVHYYSKSVYVDTVGLRRKVMAMLSESYFTDTF